MASSSSRTAFTMLELVLVMAIIVMISAIAYPMVKDGYSHVKVVGACDTVKAAWAQARARAIEDGISYRFSVVPSGRRFRVAPDQAQYWTGTNPDPTDPEHPPLILEGTLPKETGFTINGSKIDPAAAEKDEKGPVDPSTLVTMAVFQPDGTAQDDRDIEFNVKGTKATLHLRALTGTGKTITGKESR